MSEIKGKKKIVIAGSSGYVGDEFVKSLLKAGEFDVIGISRSGRSNFEGEGYEVRKANLFSLKEAENAMSGGDIGVFLVHSMLPTDRLAQGNFKDFDYIIADNFARTAKKYNFEKVIYLGGLMPDDSDLSDHLESRLEVEKILGSYGIPCITIRSGLILGAMGSSFQIMLKLVERLPVLVCPKWSDNETQAVSIEEVVEKLSEQLRVELSESKVIQIGNPEITSYKGLLKHIAKARNKKRLIFSLNLNASTFSKF